MFAHALECVHILSRFGPHLSACDVAASVRMSACKPAPEEVQSRSVSVAMFDSFEGMGDETSEAGTPESRSITLWIRRISVLFTIMLTVIVFAGYSIIPDEVPTHFTLLGKADSYGQKWALLPVVAIVAAIVLGLAWLSRRPNEARLPFVINDESSATVHAGIERLLVWAAASFTVMHAGTVLAAFGWTNSPLLFIGGLALVGSLVVGVWRSASAAHTVDKNYQFHGTFSAKDNQTIQYSDKFTFPVGFNIGTLKIGGKVRFTN